MREGLEQCVVLGAGLDSLAYRLTWEDVTVFEVDRPATQAAKRQRVAGAQLGQSLAGYFMPGAAAAGEPWINFLTPSEVAHVSRHTR